jgi:hypothetical protein
MLIGPTAHLFTYVIARDFGFAPNPFHGLCTLATCKPGIRKSAKSGDWILGVGGAKLRQANRKCILLMRVSEKLSFQDYWNDPRFSLKKPCRNGSLVRMIGDNIYHKSNNDEWLQEDSHHSNPDGTINHANLERDTESDQVLVSDYFYYFGREAISVDLESISYTSGIGFKKIKISSCNEAKALIESIDSTNRNNTNVLIADPNQFVDSHKRVDQRTGKIA